MMMNQIVDFKEQKLTHEHMNVLESFSSYNKDQAEQHFDKLAYNYEGAYQRAGYPDPLKCAEYVQMFQKNNGQTKDVQILDFGCGTGLVGQHLKKMGFNNIIGLDISQNMLDIAEEKDAYMDLDQINLGQSDNYKSFPPLLRHKFDFVTSAGLIMGNHMDQNIFEQMLLCLKPGGIIIFTARHSFMGNFWYQNILSELEAVERLKFIKCDSFFKYNQLGVPVGKFVKTPVKVFAYKKIEQDSVLGNRRHKSLRHDEIENILKQNMVEMMKKKMKNLEIKKKIPNKVFSPKPKPLQIDIKDFRQGA